MRRVHKHKFNATRCEYDGQKFDSRAEKQYYQKLKFAIKAGEVLFFLRQVPFHLPGGVTYRVDYQEFHADGTVHFIDVKGFETTEFKTKKRLVESLYPVEIEVVKSR